MNRLKVFYELIHSDRLLVYRTRWHNAGDVLFEEVRDYVNVVCFRNVFLETRYWWVFRTIFDRTLEVEVWDVLLPYLQINL